MSPSRFGFSTPTGSDSPLSHLAVVVQLPSTREPLSWRCTVDYLGPSACQACALPPTTVPAQKESLVWQGIPARGKGCWQNSISIQKARAISCSGRSGNLQPSCLLIPTLAKKVSGCSLTFLFLLSCAILICLLANPSTSFLCISAKNWKALLASSCLSICSHWSRGEEGAARERWLE